MNTHILIVDATTLRLHLEHGFIGTGKQEDKVDFNNSANTGHGPQTENVLVSMMADGSRMRRGDQVIFYLQESAKPRVSEGKFFGVFRTRENGVFLDDNTDGQFLRAELGKSLTFRALIEPDTVYAEGVTEWEALDEIRNIAAPYQMLWSLIYRKLRGNRGNTMITPYEAERLVHLIRNKNGRQRLATAGHSVSFNTENQRIVVQNGQPQRYAGRQIAINILPRLEAKYNLNRAFEAHLQAYITQRLGRGLNVSLDNSIINAVPVEWLGNEVSCGVGMQRIDVMAEVNIDGQRMLVPTELKAGTAEAKNARQIQRYVDWIEQYYLPNRPSDIRPVLVAKVPTQRQRNGPKFNDFIQSVRQFNRDNPNIHPLTYVEFELRNGDLHFQRVQLQ